jgi:HK97 family phage major capsid protein
MSTKALIEERAKLVAEARAEFDKITDKTTEAEAKEIEARYDTIMAKVNGLGSRIDRAQQLEDAERELDKPIETRAGRDDPDADPDKAKAEQAKAYEGAFRSYLRFGHADLSPEERKVLRVGFVADNEKRAQSTTTTAGGYTIPEGFQRELEKALLAFGGMLSAARILPTSTGNALPWPTVNDTTNEGALLAENTAASEQDVTFGTETLNAYKYTSKLIKVSSELMQDSAFDMDAYLREALSERLARILNRHATTGTGTDQPQGVVGASTAGKTAASSSAVTFDELRDLIHSVDPAYRDRGLLMFHDNTLLALSKLKDDQSRYLWMPSPRDGEPDRIWGYRYSINQHMPVFGSGNKSILFGDFKKYIIRIVRQTVIRRLDERYAEADQVAFVGFSRFDGELIDAGTNPIKHLVHPSP